MISLVIACITVTSVLFGCKSKKTITIYSSAEDYRNENARQMLNEKFPEYNINLIDTDTGTLAAKIAAEGKESDADIILEMEATYMKKVSDSLATLDNVDFSKYLDDAVPENHKYVPWTRMGVSVIVDKKALADRGLAIPTSYDDILKPEYKGLVSMPNPKSSGTGYVFYLNMVNERGEKGALEYFDKLAENISGQGFTTSGSGPVKALVTGEAAIAFGMIFHGAEEITKGNDFEILMFEEGAPYTIYSSGIIEGKQNDEDVMKVFDYIVSDITPRDKELFAPEPIYKDKTYKKANFPDNIKYADMTGGADVALKERLLDMWNH